MRLETLTGELVSITKCKKCGSERLHKAAPKNSVCCEDCGMISCSLKNLQEFCETLSPEEMGMNLRGYF